MLITAYHLARVPHWRVWLDGRDVSKHVVAVDPEAGYAILLAQHKGKAVRDAEGRAKTVRLFGRIALQPTAEEIRDAKHRGCTP